MKARSRADGRWRRRVTVIPLMFLASSPSAAQRKVTPTGPKVDFCGVLAPNVTRPGSFDIRPKIPYGTGSCPNLFRVRWVGANNTRVHSLPAQAGGKAGEECGRIAMRQIVHRENADPATGTTHFTLIGDSTIGCAPVPQPDLTVECMCSPVSAAVDKGANYRVYAGCVITPHTGSPKQCEFHTCTDDVDKGAQMCVGTAQSNSR
jgi:hypothetical protein